MPLAVDFPQVYIYHVNVHSELTAYIMGQVQVNHTLLYGLGISVALPTIYKFDYTHAQ